MKDEFPPNPRPLRRGDVVHERDHGGYIMFGRVWRRHDANHVVVIDCGKHITLYRDDELVLSDYEGYERMIGPEVYPVGPDGETDWFAEPLPRKTRQVPMTSLRRLKQIAREYNPDFGGRRCCGYRWTKKEQKEARAHPRRFVPHSQRRIQGNK